MTKSTLYVIENQIADAMAKWLISKYTFWISDD